jgi:hypothetical protein
VFDQLGSSRLFNKRGKPVMNRLTSISIALSLILLSSSSGYAAQRIAVLNFELNDITSLPNTVAEQQRTASIAPLLSKALSQTAEYQIVPIDAGLQKSANASFGYLFRFHDVAAQLGRQFGVDWIIVSQHSKPSFLESYLITHLIQVKTQTLAARYDIALKGNHEKVTRHAVNKLADKIHESINKQGD